MTIATTIKSLSRAPKLFRQFNVAVNGNLGVELDTVKEYFFDRQRVIRAIDARSHRAIKRIALYIRKVAINSIKKAGKPGGPKFYSLPGQPPKSHTGLLKKFIFASYDPRLRSAVVGPTKLALKPYVVPVSQPTVPALLEFGGTGFSKQPTFYYVPTGKKKVDKRGRVRKTEQYESIRIPPGPRKYEARPYMRPALAKAVTSPVLQQAWSVI